MPGSLGQGVAAGRLPPGLAGACGLAGCGFAGAWVVGRWLCIAIFDGRKAFIGVGCVYGM